MPRTPSKQTRLGRLRIIAGCEGKALASDAGISYQLLKMIESGKEKSKRRMTEETARKISMATGVSFDWLMGGGPKTKPTTDRSRIERFSQEPFTREHYLATRAAADAASSFLNTTKDVDDFCRIEAKNHAGMFARNMENALRCATRTGEQSKVLAFADKCLRTLQAMQRGFLTPEEKEINAAFEAKISRRRATAQSSKTPRHRRA